MKRLRQPGGSTNDRAEHSGKASADEQTVLDDLTDAFPSATWVDTHQPGSDAVEIDLRRLHLLLNPFRLAAELEEWGELDYHCYGCHQHFVAPILFEAHRVAVPERPGGKRCLTEAELRRGGLLKSRQGIWRLGSPTTSHHRRDPVATSRVGHPSANEEA